MEEVLKAILEATIETLFYLTGHSILWIVSMGRWGMSNGRDELAAIVGVPFWIAVGVGIWLAFYR